MSHSLHQESSGLIVAALWLLSLCTNVTLTSLALGDLLSQRGLVSESPMRIAQHTFSMA